MSIFTRHIAYLRDNPEGYWFKRKLYGYGWTPVRWQGWLVTLLAVLGVIGVALRFERMGAPEDALWRSFVLPIVAIIVVLIAICYRTGEAPRWQWGLPKDREQPNE